MHHPPRVLVVEDSATLAFTYRAILSQNGYSVTTAETRDAGLAELQSQSFDILLCDLTLDHGHSGLEVIAFARGRCPQLPVALLTGYDDVEIRMAAAQLGVSVLAKPIGVGQLLVSVQWMLGTVEQERSQIPERLAKGASTSAA